VNFAINVDVSRLFVAGDLSSERGTVMTLFSVYEDFVIRTLAGIEGAFAKLSYLASIRKKSGEYVHWGLSRTFGSQQTSEALGQAHTAVWLELLRKPIPALFAESQEAVLAADAEGQQQKSLQEMRTLIPSNLGGGSKRHFNSILLAISLLSQSANQSNQPAA
jgi:hypothetical protein